MNEQHQFTVGERVAYHGGFNRSISVKTIERITTKGTIVCGGNHYRPDGWQKGGDRFYRTRISKLTPELEEKAARERNLYTVGNFQPHTLTNDSLQKLVDFINQLPKESK